MRARRDGGELHWDGFDPPADGGLPASEAIVAGPGEGERLVAGDRVAVLKGVLPDLSFADWTLVGSINGPHLHRHDDQVDAFYVLEGELDITVEGSVHTAGPDTLAWVPRGIWHTFGHSRAGKARFLNVHAPDGGFAEFLRRISD
jgi:mannose-6-phosphate isomerase-like protein (cupin superfamily)